jgi:DNA-directed RNA polymerase subunit RPC12/RpoP
MKGTQYEVCGACGKRGAHLRSYTSRITWETALVVECRYCGARISSGWTFGAEDRPIRMRFHCHWREIAAELKAA